MTGDLTMQKSRPKFDQKDTSKSFRLGQTSDPAYYTGEYHAFDSNNEYIFYSESGLLPNGNVQRSYVVRRYNANGTTSYNNGFYLGLDASGDPYVSFTSNAAAAWMQGLNALPQSGGTMTGAINFNSRGQNRIYNGPNDAANGVGGALNNLVIDSWYGVSFTTQCTGQTYTGKNAVTINTRNGNVYAAQYNDSGAGLTSLDASKLASGTLADARLPTKGSAGTAGTSSATSGATLAVPYVTTDAYGRVTAKGTHTHTISGLATSAVSGLGTTLSSDGSATFNNETWTSCGGSVTLTAGTWVVIGTVYFRGASGGSRRGVALNNTTPTINATQCTFVPPTAGYTMVVEKTRIIKVSANTTYYVYGYQNSGSTLGTSESKNVGRIDAIRIN